MNATTTAGHEATVARRNWIALVTIMRREIARILRIWGQTLVPPAITMTLYFLIFGGLIGSRVGTMDGIAYMDFIVPGLVMMSVIQNSYGNISSSFFGAKFGRHVEELLVSPMPSWVVLGGYVAGAVLRGLMVGIIVLCIAMFFTKVRLPHPLFEGDTLYAQSEVLETRESRSRPHMGIVRLRTTGFNQDGSVVIEFVRAVMVYRRGQVPQSTRPEPRRE